MKIGDIVYSEKYGKGKIVCDSQFGFPPYGIEFEKYNSELHSLDGKCKSGHGYWCNNNVNYKDSITYVRPYKFTKKDLRVGDKVLTKKGVALIISDKKNARPFKIEDLKDNEIIKVKRPTYTTIFEREEEILDEKEKEYLSAVIRPFKDRVSCIRKRLNEDDEFIDIRIKSSIMGISFPKFKKGIMYKNMEIDRGYTLKELGLDE